MTKNITKDNKHEAIDDRLMLLIASNEQIISCDQLDNYNKDVLESLLVEIGILNERVQVALVGHTLLEHDSNPKRV